MWPLLGNRDICFCPSFARKKRTPGDPHSRFTLGPNNFGRLGINLCAQTIRPRAARNNGNLTFFEGDGHFSRFESFGGSPTNCNGYSSLWVCFPYEGASVATDANKPLFSREKLQLFLLPIIADSLLSRHSCLRLSWIGGTFKRCGAIGGGRSRGQGRKGGVGSGRMAFTNLAKCVWPELRAIGCGGWGGGV